MISKNPNIKAIDYAIKEYVNLDTIVELNEEKEYFLIKLRIGKNQFYEHKFLKKVIQQLKYEDWEKDEIIRFLASVTISCLKNLKPTINGG